MSIEEAEKRLTRGALYNIDAGWKDSIDTYIDDKEIESYQEAFNYINQVKPSDLKAYDWADKITPEYIKAEMAAEKAAIDAENAAANAASEAASKAEQEAYLEENGYPMPSTTLSEITVTATRDPKYTYYIDTENNSFTATKEDFNNEEIFLVDALGGNTNPNSDDYNEAKVLMDNSAAIKPSEVSFFEGIGRDIRSGKGTVVGFSKGVGTGFTDTVKAIFSGAEKVVETTEDLINDPQRTIKSGANTVGTLIGNAPEIAQETLDQLEDAAALSNAKLKLYDLQQNAGAKSEYKANIAGQIAGGGGVGSAGKQVVKKIDDVASEIGKGLDSMTPKPATVTGTPDIGGATTITGKPDGNKLGTAETGGAILSTGGGDSDKLYDNIRADNTDISLIAKNTGLKPENIEKVKNHVFYDEHLLDKYVDYGIPAEKTRFDSSLEKSQAQERLKTANYTEDDITWLKHETAERWYENKNSAGYTESHDVAEQKWSGNPWEIDE